ncbi:hypothetical protein MJO29_001511, partial [Puccinia striiformis f. sp. tritici]
FCVETRGRDPMHVCTETVDFKGRMNTSVAVDETNIVLSQTSQTPKKAAAKTGKKTNMAITKPVQDITTSNLNEEVNEQVQKTKKKKHRKDKPWNTDDIDQWKIKPFAESDKEKIKSTTEESSFATLFPKYRKVYLKEIWSHPTKVLDQHGVACVLNLVKGSMTAVKIPDNDVASDVIKIGNIIQNKEPEPSHIIVIELLMDHYLLVQGKTISAMGPYKCLKVVWHQHQPSSSGVQNNSQAAAFRIEQSKQPQEKKKKKYTPFPPPQMPRKVSYPLILLFLEWIFDTDLPSLFSYYVPIQSYNKKPINLELESGESFKKKSQGLTTTGDKSEELSSSKSKKVKGKEL